MVKLNHQDIATAEKAADIFEALAPNAQNSHLIINEVLPDKTLVCLLAPVKNLIGKFKTAHTSTDERRILEYGDKIKIPMAKLEDANQKTGVEKIIAGFDSLIGTYLPKPNTHGNI